MKSLHAIRSARFVAFSRCFCRLWKIWPATWNGIQWQLWRGSLQALIETQDLLAHTAAQKQVPSFCEDFAKSPNMTMSWYVYNTIIMNIFQGESMILSNFHSAHSFLAGWNSKPSSFKLANIFIKYHRGWCAKSCIGTVLQTLKNIWGNRLAGGDAGAGPLYIICPSLSVGELAYHVGWVGLGCFDILAH